MTKVTRFLKEHDKQVLTASGNNNITILYRCDRDDLLEQGIMEFAKNLDVDGEVVTFEECVEKGGGGGELLLQLYDFFSFSIKFVLGAGASALIGKGVEKIFTKENFRKLLKTKSDSVINEKVCCEMHYQGHIIKYIIPSYLNFEEAEQAFTKIAGHFRGLCESKFSSSQSEFIYDRKASDWQPF